jgi:hypothetical protein
MSAYSLKDLKKRDLTSVSGSVTRSPISEMFSISQQDSTRLTVDIVISSATKDGGSTTFSAYLESSLDGVNWDFTAIGTVAIATAGARTVLTIQHNATASGTYLRPWARVVVTSDNANNTVAISNVLVSRRSGYPG